MSATSALIVVALSALGNIVPQSRQILQEVTGLSSITLGVVPAILLLTTCLQFPYPIDELIKQADFPVDQATLDVPQGVLLLVAAALLGVFAAAVGCAEDDQGKKEKSVELVKADRIAMRFACAAGLIGFFQIAQLLPSSPKQGFASSEIVLEVPEGICFLMASTLIMVFKMVVDSEEEKEDKPKSHVELVSVSRIALRFAVASGLFGLLRSASNNQEAIESACAFLSQVVPTGSSPDFATSGVVVQAPESIMLFSIAALLFIFKLAVSEDSAETENDASVQLVKVDAIAFRLSLAAALCGLTKLMSEIGAMKNASSFAQMLPASPAEGFAKADVSLGASEGMQLLAVGALIYIFKMAVNEADDMCSDDEKKPQIELVNSAGIAFRLSVLTLIVGCVKLALGNSDLVSTGVSAWGGLTQENVMTAVACLGQLFPASSSRGFATSAAELQVPEGIQFLLIATLLLVFKLAIDDDEEPKEKRQEKPMVQLVSASRIALRLSAGAGAIGLGKLVAPVIEQSMHTIMNSGDLLAKGAMLGTSTAVVLYNVHKQAQNVKAC